MKFRRAIRVLSGIERIITSRRSYRIPTHEDGNESVLRDRSIRVMQSRYRNAIAFYEISYL
jgi:hypothetical protein